MPPVPAQVPTLIVGLGENWALLCVRLSQPFLFSILAYFDISCFLSLDLDTCSHLSLPLFVPLELVHRLSPTTFFPRSVCSPSIHYLLMDHVVYSLHVYKAAICVSMRLSCFPPLLSVCPLAEQQTYHRHHHCHCLLPSLPSSSLLPSPLPLPYTFAVAFCLSCSLSLLPHSPAFSFFSPTLTFHRISHCLQTHTDSPLYNVLVHRGHPVGMASLGMLEC